MAYWESGLGYKAVVAGGGVGVQGVLDHQVCCCYSGEDMQQVVALAYREVDGNAGPPSRVLMAMEERARERVRSNEGYCVVVVSSV